MWFYTHTQNVGGGRDEMFAQRAIVSGEETTALTSEFAYGIGRTTYVVACNRCGW
jgi:hypothetical protein